MKTIQFEKKAWEQFNDWGLIDKKIQKKLFQLISETAKTPFKSKGKPEALKRDFKGCWSRRIDDEHRLIYKVTNESIIIISCKYHYS